MTELTDAQLRSILGGAKTGPPAHEAASLPYWMRDEADIPGLPSWAAAMHKDFRDAMGNGAPAMA
jgi:hypothetical protein